MIAGNPILSNQVPMALAHVDAFSRSVDISDLDDAPILIDARSPGEIQLVSTFFFGAAAELVGLADEYGAKKTNDMLATMRAQNVKKALVAAKYPGKITFRSITGEQANRGDYAEMRSVEMLRPGALSRA